MELLDFLNDGSIAFVRDDDAEETYRTDYWDGDNLVLHVHDEDTSDEFMLEYERMLNGNYTFMTVSELDIMPTRHMS